jgi:1-acyl-sn-glycerol-3-phosphate acyltransferase
MLLTRSIIFNIAFYTTTVVMLLGLVWLLLVPRRWAVAALEWHARICLSLLGRICRVKLEVRGAEKIPSGACLVAAKHQSAWDTFALLTLFADPAIVMKEELKFIPVYGWFCLKLEHILVKRERAAVALRRLIGDARGRVSLGRQVLIFPEGTRQTPGAPPDYKPGYIALYEALDVPCVPVALNSGLYWPRRSVLRHPGTIVVEILDPIQPGLRRGAFRQELETALEAACDRLLAEAAASADPPPLANGTSASGIEIKV